MNEPRSIKEVIDDIAELILVRTNPVLLINALLYEGFTPTKAETIMRWAFHQAQEMQKDLVYVVDGIPITIDWGEFYSKEY